MGHREKTVSCLDEKLDNPSRMECREAKGKVPMGTGYKIDDNGALVENEEQHNNVFNVLFA